MSTAPALRPRPPRVPFVRPISLRPVDGSRDAQWLLAGNLSLGGCFVRTAKPLPVGSEVKLELEAHGQALPFALAEVVWSRAIGEVPSSAGLPGCGLRFKSLSAEARALVMHLIDLGGTGRGQSRTQPLGMTIAPKNPTREPIHAPVALIRDYLNTPPQSSAAASADVEAPSSASPPPAPRPTPLRLVPVAPEAITDPHGMPALDARSSLLPSPKIEVDLGALHLEPTKSSSFAARTQGTAPAHTPAEPWFDQAELQPRRPAEPTFEVASVGPVPVGSSEAPPRRGASLLASLLAGMAVGGAILGALVLAQKGLHLAESSASFHGPSLISFDSAPTDATKSAALALDNPRSAPAPLPVEPAPVAKRAALEPVLSVKVHPIVVTAMVEPLVKAPSAPSKEVGAAAPPSLAGTSGTGTEVEIALPTGAAKAIRVGGTPQALEVEPELAAGASINHVFSLSGPSRLVIDLDGSTPHGSPRVDGRGGVAGIRLGVRPGGTRLVLDLAQPARHVRTQGNRITVELSSTP